jgi:hypothetical protein
LIIRDTLPDEAAARLELTSLMEKPPEGHHLWSAKLQRSDRGRRCQVEVQYRRDKNTPPPNRD